MNPAVLVVDMTNEFTTGRLGSAAVVGIIPAVRRVIAVARRARIPVIYVQDAHRQGDPELKVWGRHAMAGTAAAITHPALTSRRGEPIVRKRSLSLFYRTTLDRVLRARRVDTLVLTGVATEYCIQHGAADGHFRGYRTMVLKDCTAGLTPAAKRTALAYMQKAYGVEVVTSNQWLRRLAA